MNIVANQRRSYLATAMDDTRRLAQSLMSLSPAERAAIIATLTAQTEANLDLVYLADDESEPRDAAAICDGVLRRCCGESYTWRLGQNNLFSIVSLRKLGEAL